MPKWTIAGINVDAYLALNGMTREPSVMVGGDRLAFAGGSRRDVAARKQPWSGRTVPLAGDVAEALRRLVGCEADAWPFDSDTFSASLRPLATGTGTVGGGGKYGGRIFLPSPSGITYDVGAGASWSVWGWKQTNSGGVGTTWNHFIRTSSGSKYKNGVTTTEETGFSVSGTVLTIAPAYNTAGLFPWSPDGYSPGDRIVEAGRVFEVSDTIPPHGNASLEPNWAAVPGPGVEVEEDPGGIEGGPWIWVEAGDAWFDDVVFFPALLPAGWPEQVHTEHAARAWTAPAVRFAGDLVGAAAVTARGRVSVGRGAPHKRSTGYDKTGEVLEFELQEV